MAEKTSKSTLDGGPVVAKAGAADADLAKLNLTRTGASRLVALEGKIGVFTPVTEDGGGATTEANLEQIIAVLRDRVAALESEKDALAGKLAQITAASQRTPDDFATAISHSLDSLQSRLQEAKNPVSRFAVREFSIETKVHVEVTPVGTVAYRFLKPEEAVDPQRLSKISMTVVPITRESEEGAWSSPAFTPQVDIEEIQGIGEGFQRKLNQSNIYTIGDLLTAGTRVRSQVELAGMLDVDRNRLAQWLSHAELMTVKEIGGRQAEVLHMLGIARLDQLAEATPEQLTADYNARVQAEGRKSLQPVEQAAVARWIDTARAFAGKKA